MNDTEIQRIAAAMNAARPDWPASSVATLIRTKLANRPRRDVFVALAWVASEADSKTPARVLESGPWWRAAAAEESASGHHHIATVYGSSDGDPREVCAECAMHRSECERRAATNGHAFRSRIDAARPHVHGDDCPKVCERMFADETHPETPDPTTAEPKEGAA